MIQARSADGVIHQFPDGTPDAVINKAMADYARSLKKDAAPPKAPAPRGGVEVEWRSRGKPTPRVSRDQRYDLKGNPFGAPDDALPEIKSPTYVSDAEEAEALRQRYLGDRKAELTARGRARRRPEVPTQARMESTPEGTFTRHALGGVLPTVAGIMGGGVGAFGGTGVGALAGPAAPVAMPVLGFAGGMSTGTLAANAAREGQTKFLREHTPLSVQRLFGADPEQEALDQKEHPYAALSGDLLPGFLGFRPEAKRLSVALGGAMGGGTEAWRQYTGEEDVDPWKIAISTAAGAAQGKPWGLGRMAFGRPDSQLEFLIRNTRPDPKFVESNARGLRDSGIEATPLSVLPWRTTQSAMRSAAGKSNEAAALFDKYKSRAGGVGSQSALAASQRITDDIVAEDPRTRAEAEQQIADQTRDAQERVRPGVTAGEASTSIAERLMEMWRGERSEGDRLFAEARAKGIALLGRRPEPGRPDVGAAMEQAPTDEVLGIRRGGGMSANADYIASKQRSAEHDIDPPLDEGVAQIFKEAGIDPTRRSTRYGEGYSAKGLSGPVTAETQTLKLPVDAIKDLPGANDEKPRPGSPKYDRLAASVRENGFTDESPITIYVNHRGDAFVTEGNNRLALARETGQPTISARVVWKNGAEQTLPTDSRWHPDNVAALVREPVSKPAAAPGDVVRYDAYDRSVATPRDEAWSPTTPEQVEEFGKEGWINSHTSEILTPDEYRDMQRSRGPGPEVAAFMRNSISDFALKPSKIEGTLGLLDDVDKWSTVDTGNLYGLRKSLSDLERAYAGDSDAAAAGKARRALDAFMAQADAEGRFTGDPDVVSANRDAIDYWRRFNQRYPENSILGALTQTEWRGDTQAPVVDPNTAAAKILGNVTETGDRLRNLTELRDRLLENGHDDLWNGLRMEALDRVAGGPKENNPQYVEKIDAWAQKNPKMAALVLGDGGVAALGAAKTEITKATGRQGAVELGGGFLHALPSDFESGLQKMSGQARRDAIVSARDAIRQQLKTSDGAATFLAALNSNSDAMTNLRRLLGPEEMADFHRRAKAIQNYAKSSDRVADLPGPHEGVQQPDYAAAQITGHVVQSTFARALAPMVRYLESRGMSKDAAVRLTRDALDPAKTDQIVEYVRKTYNRNAAQAFASRLREATASNPFAVYGARSGTQYAVTEKPKPEKDTSPGEDEVIDFTKLPDDEINKSHSYFGDMLDEEVGFEGATPRRGAKAEMVEFQPMAYKPIPIEELRKRVLHQESGGNPKAVSPKGAKGLMQIMDDTGRDPGNGVMPLRDDSPGENVRFGNDYLDAMIRRFGSQSLALMANNWGPTKVERWIAGGMKGKVPKETRDYVVSILGPRDAD